MSTISTDLVKKAIYNLCFEANTCLNSSIYEKIKESYFNIKDKKTKNIFESILENAKIAYKTKHPLCQDTGQVIVFLEIGQNVKIEGEFIETAINSAVANCYNENFFRKSVVNNAIFDRTNTKNNTPAIIYTKYIEGENININVLIKGAGSENKSKLEMFLPTTTKEDLIKQVGDIILSAELNACPPMFIGIGAGATADKAMLLSKEAFFYQNQTREEKEFADRIKNYVNSKNKNFENYVLDIKLKTTATHIACMPLAITINCHSDRMASCTISENKISYNQKKTDFITIDKIKEKKQEIYTTDIDKIRKLKKGKEILLTGEIYVARDMAHKRIQDLINNNKSLPFEIKDKIIFYAGPCPNKPNEISGSIGPTTASRMDKYAIELYKKGLLATIGKGNRNKEVKRVIKETNSKYFTVTGGIAALLADKVKTSQIIAFDDLGTEAIYKLYVEKFPITVEL